LDLSEYEKPENISNLDIYKIFLRTIIPKIRILFLLVKKYIKGRLSLVDVVNYLEPFMIYPIDLTYMQYREINNFIYEKIKEYNTKFKEYGAVFSSLRYVKNQKKGTTKNTYTFSNPLFSVLDTKSNLRFNNEIMDIYGYDNPNSMNISGSEFLKNITISDYGNLFNTAVALTNIELMFPNSLTNVFDNDKERMKEIIEKDKREDKCSSYVIAKKYYSSESLLSDNQKIIYYDKEFDTTNYEILEEKYKKQRDALTSEDFILFLTEEFKNKNKMDESSAEYMATTLVNQAKRVREGDYALLIVSLDGGELNDKMADQMEYYVRRDDIWVLDKELDPKVFIKDDDILCNIDYSCIYDPLSNQKKDENKCQSTEVSKDSIIQSTLKQIIDQFDKNYDISKVELNKHITNNINQFKTQFDRLQEMKKKYFLKMVKMVLL
jgi:hypothetical protein